MTREERLKALFDELERDAYNAEYHNYYYKEANQIIRKHFELSLPPAKGATDKFRDVLHEVQRLIETEGGATESEMKAIWNSLSCAITESERRSQPPAEGAEEILDGMDLGEPIQTGEFYYRSEVLKAMTEFATLHAQRIADKMVEENLVEFGNMIRDEPNGDIAALAEYFIRTINLKSREK